jgi:hypothetical protein
MVSGNLSAQEKFEKESRIKSKDVPSKALWFLDSLNFDTKIKWYKDEGLDKTTVEAKFKLNKVKHSVEFDLDGNLVDVEKEVTWESLEPQLKASISSQLQMDCKEHKIEKVQNQFTGNQNDVFSMLKTAKTDENIAVKHEIVVKCHHQNEVDLFEYLFDDQGELVFKSKIVFKNSSHLEY